MCVTRPACSSAAGRTSPPDSARPGLAAPVALPILRGSLAPSCNGRDDRQARRRMIPAACRSALCRYFGGMFPTLSEAPSIAHRTPSDRTTHRLVGFSHTGNTQSRACELRRTRVRCLSVGRCLSDTQNRKSRIDKHLRKPRAQTTSALPPNPIYAAQNRKSGCAEAESQQTLQIKVFPNIQPPK